MKNLYGERDGEMSAASETIQLPIRAGNVFRLLAMRTTVEDPDFVAAVNENFDSLLCGIGQTKRLTDEKKFPEFRNYEHRPDDDRLTAAAFEKLSEEELCKNKGALFRDLGGLGKAVDFQVSLTHSRDTAEGVVDLLTRNGDDVYLVEVKKWNSSEHPLRALFEALTFWLYVVDQKRTDAPNARTFVERFGSDALGVSPSRAVVRPAILIRRGSKIHDKMMKADVGNPYSDMYGKLLKYVRCFEYCAQGDNLTAKDFTGDFLKRLMVKN